MIRITLLNKRILINTRNSLFKLLQPNRKTNQGQRSLSYIGPSVWNKLPDSFKSAKDI